MLNHWSDAYVRGWNCVLGPVGVILNAILIVLILSKTPGSLRCYSLILLVSSVFDCAISLGSSMVTTRIFPTEGHIFTMFSGLCNIVSDNLEIKAHFCMSWYVLQFQSYLLNHVVLIISSIYRVTIMVAPLCKEIKYALPAICFVYSTVHVGYSTWVLLGDLIPLDQVIFAIAGVRPELIGSGWTYFGVLELDMPMFFMSMILPWLVIVFTLSSRWFVGRRVRKMHFSKLLEKHHKDLSNALLAQTLAPVLSILGAVAYLIVRENEIDSVPLFENLMLTPIVLMAVINPIVTIYSVQPYRTTVAGWGKSTKMKIYPAVAVSAIVNPPPHLN